MKIHTKIRQMPWPEPYRGGNRHFRVTLSWPVVDRERLMVATFSRNLEKATGNHGADFRLVCSKKQQAVTVLTKGDSRAARKQLDDMLGTFGTHSRYCYSEISDADEKALARWLGKPDIYHNHMMPELAGWVADAIDAETLRDDDVALCPSELPAGLVEWIRREVLTNDDVLLYKKGNTRGTCYLCRTQVRAFRQRFTQNSIVECPNCGRRVTALLETSDRFKVDYVRNIASVQKGTDGRTVFIRLWHLTRDYTAEWGDIPKHLVEVARWAIRGRKAAKWQLEAKNNYYWSTERYKLRGWERENNVSEVYDGYCEFYFPIDWESAVEGTSLEYCDLAAYRVSAWAKHITVNEIRFLLDWARYPAVEKFWKAGYTDPVFEKVTAIPKEFRYTVAWNRETIPEAIPFPKRLLKLREPSQWTLRELQKVKEAWAMVGRGLIREREILELLDCPVPVEYFKTALGHATVHKICAYLEKHMSDKEKKQIRWRHGNIGHTPITYRDYLAECVTLGLDLDDPVILFPPNLDEAHIRTAAQIKYEADKKSEELFQRTNLGRKWMEWQQGDLLIRLPKSGAEIIAEGKALQHCVGGYVERAAKGLVTILFIRRAAEPDVPYYTLEWTNGRLVQCKSMRNRDYKLDADVEAFVAAWIAQHKKLKNNRKEKTA